MPITHEALAGCEAGKIEFDGAGVRATTPWGESRPFECPLAAMAWLSGKLAAAKAERRAELQGGFR